jgi:membrane-bound serine protease (ClpP class)
MEVLMNRRSSLRQSFFVFAFVILGTLLASADVVKIKIDGPIHAITEEQIERALDRARQQNAEAVLIELRTPGGLSDSTRDIVEKMLASPVPVIVYVTPSGGRAASAGFFILQAADVAAMAPGTNTGAAHPVIIGGGNLDSVMKSKLENDAAAWMRSVVSKRGRNVELAETAVRESKSWSDQEALSQKLIDVVATDQNDLFKQLEGRSIKRFDGTSTTLHLLGKKVDEMPMSLKQKILGWMMDPNITFFILAIGAMALYAEFNHPGAIIPGVVGLIFILLAIFALNLLPTRFAALALILAAFVLFALEAKYVSHGVLGTGGIVALTLGGLLLVDGPIPEMRVKLWTALGVSIPLGIITIFLMTIAVRARRNKVTTGSQGLVGETGIARTPLTPEGKVFVHGEIWDARSSVPIQPGDTIVVRSVNGLHLEVEPVTASNRHDDLVRI